MSRARSKTRPAPHSGNAISDRIVAAARRHFFADGFRRITMEELAGELGMSKKTLYTCFAGKNALVQAVMLAKVREIEASLECVVAVRSADFLDDLHRLLECVQRHSAEIRPPFVRDLQREAPELFSLIESRRRDLIHRHFKGLLYRGRKAGVIRKDIPTHLITEILLGTADAIVNPRKVLELGLTPQIAYRTILQMLFEGVIVRDGKVTR